MHIYGRDADDTLEWIQEKEGVVSSEDFGHDLESTQALVSKHEVLEVNKEAENRVIKYMLPKLCHPF